MNIIEITDFSDENLDVYARLTENQLINRHNPNEGIFIAESPKVIERALNAGITPLSVLIEKKHIEEQAKEVLEKCTSICPDIPIFTAEFDVLTKLTGFKLTRGMLCAMRRPALKSVDEIITGSRRIAVLEDVMNPTNVGAIFRSAAALNIDGILLTGSCSNPLYRRCLRVSMGCVFQIPWTIMDSDSYISKLKEYGFKTAAMALKEDSVSIDDSNLMNEEKLAIILGNEGYGLSSSTILESDYTVLIPMSHDVDSLNVAAASAVAFWQLGNNRR